MILLYQKHLKSQLSQTEFLFLSLLLQTLTLVRTVKLEVLSNALPLPITAESRRKKLNGSWLYQSLTWIQFGYPFFNTGSTNVFPRLPLST